MKKRYLGQPIKCRWCGEIRHLKAGHVFLCEECDQYKEMIRDLSDQAAKERRRPWWKFRSG